MARCAQVRDQVMGGAPVFREASGGGVAQGCYEMHRLSGVAMSGAGAVPDSGNRGMISAGGGAANLPPNIYFNKINWLSNFFIAPVVSDAAHDPAIYVTHFKLREAELIMAQMTTADVISPDEYASAEPDIRIHGPAQRLAPAVTAVAGTVR